MERAAWTDERLDDLAESIRTGFARTDEDIRALRSEVHAGDRSLRQAIESGDQSVRAEVRELRGDIRELRRLTTGVGGGIIVTLIAAIVTRGI